MVLLSSHFQGRKWTKKNVWKPPARNWLKLWMPWKKGRFSCGSHIGPKSSNDSCINCKEAVGTNCQKKLVTLYTRIVIWQNTSSNSDIQLRVSLNVIFLLMTVKKWNVQSLASSPNLSILTPWWSCSWAPSPRWKAGLPGKWTTDHPPRSPRRASLGKSCHFHGSL